MGLAKLFKRTPNHLILIRDCYPHSKTAVEPESNALGKLTFYTRRRPIKLSKVGKALLKRSQKSSESIEHLCITLSILKKLLDECRNDVNVFSSEAMAIIDIAFKRAQGASKLSAINPHTLIELYEKTAGAFYALSTFSQAPAVEENAYLSLLRQFCQLVHDEKTMQLRLIGIHALEGVIISDLFQQLDFEEQAHLVIPTLLFAIMDSKTESYTTPESTLGTSSLAPTPNRRPSSDGLRPSLQDRRARSIRIAKGLEGTEKPPGKEDASRSAHQCLKLAFRYAQPRHLEKFLAETSAYFDERGDAWGNMKWCCWLGNRYMEWTQPQYRFAIIKYWLDELDSSQSNAGQSERQETILAVLIDQLSSPKTAVVNLAISDVLSTLIDQVVLTPHKASLRQGILALASHIYYPEQINDLVGDLLSAVLDLSDNHQKDKLRGDSEGAKVALLECCYDMVDKKGGSGLKLSGEQMQAGTAILNDPSSRVRQAYLKFLRAAFNLNTSTPNSLPHTTKSSTNSHAEIPAITVQPSLGMTTPANESSKFARDVQMRLFSYLQHIPDLSQQEYQAVSNVLEAIYEKRNAQLVLDCVPVLNSWQNAEQSETATVKPLVTKALQTIAATWQAPPVSPSSNGGEKLTASIAASTALQRATSLTEEELRERLSQPYSFSPTSHRNSVSYNRQNRRRRSPHGSISQHSAHTATNNRLSGPSSIFTTSLADLKQSLNTNGHANASPTHGNGKGSPNRSIAPSTAASSFAERGSLTPPNGFSGMTISNANGHLSPKSIGGQRKPRLDRIIGSTDDTLLNPAGGGRSPTKIRSPPYQLS
ncbi:hypothetical protein P389DRAFT_192556 [Cystobasidium minutum MCA 4210]|uniref:uncharacterized protein n=1 Tax=Cystobasidium minutum MCA 4210 TaxID=1397322 RepID=UPI0034CE66EA|eukprot:jgi/Rhomi1/192556/gm1.770_g